MRRIIYISRSLLVAAPEQLDDILTVSNARNSAAGITGMLWSDGANFAQVIEGDHDKVGATMDRIRSDPRHTDVEVVLDRQVRDRQFGNWAMRRADNGESGTAGTSFLIGFAMSERTASAKRLYRIIIATEGQGT